MKTCRRCKIDKEETEFYKPHAKCKNCMKARTIPVNDKSRGLRILTDDMKVNIKLDLENKISKKTIAEKYNVPYSTVCYWNRNGILN